MSANNCSSPPRIGTIVDVAFFCLLIKSWSKFVLSVPTLPLTVTELVILLIFVTFRSEATTVVSPLRRISTVSPTFNELGSTYPPIVKLEPEAVSIKNLVDVL